MPLTVIIENLVAYWSLQLAGAKSQKGRDTHTKPSCTDAEGFFQRKEKADIIDEAYLPLGMRLILICGSLESNVIDTVGCLTFC